MKKINTYLIEKLKINKDTKVEESALDIFNEIVNLDDEDAKVAVGDWILQNGIKTFNEIYAIEDDVHAMSISEAGKKFMHIMSTNTFDEKANQLDKEEDDLQNVYINNEKYIKICGWRRGLTYSNPKLMKKTFIFFYNKNGKS